MQSMYLLHIHLEKVLCVKSQEIITRYRDVEDLEETERGPNHKRWGGEGREAREYLRSRVVSEMFWLLGNVDGQVAGLLAHIMPYVPNYFLNVLSL